MNELPIAELDLPGGGRLGIAPLPGTYQGLAGDVARISSWHAHVVVSLTETDEMQRLGCGDLGLGSLGKAGGAELLPAGQRRIRGRVVRRLERNNGEKKRVRDRRGPVWA